MKNAKDTIDRHFGRLEWLGKLQFVLTLLFLKFILGEENLMLAFIILIGISSIYAIYIIALQIANFKLVQKGQFYWTIFYFLLFTTLASLLYYKYFVDA